MSPVTQDEIREWFQRFEACVRAVDYAGAREYVAEDVVGFGTYSAVLTGREALEAGQWANVWPAIQDFRFRFDQFVCAAEGDLAWAACPWDSQGIREDGATFPRPGRATIVLRRDYGQWRAVHTHFSLYPGSNA